MLHVVVTAEYGLVPCIIKLPRVVDYKEPFQLRFEPDLPFPSASSTSFQPSNLVCGTQSEVLDRVFVTVSIWGGCTKTATFWNQPPGTVSPVT
jgi:hypothetical protein